MKVEIWSDFVCPFCYMGERRFENALAEFEHKEQVEITFRSFQLDPNAEKIVDKDIYQIIAEKYKISYEESKANNDQIVKAASEVGLNYRFDILKPNNSGLAHQISKFAKSVGMEKVFVDRLFKAYFEEGADIGDKEQLVKLAAEVDLNVEVLKQQLEQQDLAAEVVKDQQQAMAMGIHGVPFFVIDDKYSISGAQSVGHFLKVLRKAYQE